jgi:hypothetical protein
MAVTNFSPLLGLALPTTGDLSGTWGVTVNDAITSLLDSAVAGTTTLSVDTDVTLSTTNGAANQARNAVLLCTGARTVQRTITAPAQSKAYVVINNTTGGQSIKVVGAGPTTGVVVANGAKALIVWDGSDFVTAASGTGSVTTASVVSANGFAGTVANPTTTPAITLSTSISGVLKGNGTAISAATVGTDYVAPDTATTFTAQQTFNGSTSAIAAVLRNASEAFVASATAATGTVNFDVTTQSVLYYTSNASANWTVNVRGNSSTTLDSLLSTGQSITIGFLVTTGTTAYFNSAFQVDGTAVTPKWSGGTAPSSGNASSIESYVYVIMKTGSATFNVLASRTQFK